jgi:hypothetical protein
LDDWHGKLHREPAIDRIFGSKDMKAFSQRTIIALLTIALVASNVCWVVWSQMVTPETKPKGRLVIFQVNYSFGYPAYTITQRVYVGNDTFAIYEFPERDPRGWSPAGNRGYFNWNITIPTNITTITYHLDVVFLPYDECGSQQCAVGRLVTLHPRTILLVSNPTCIAVDLYL